MIKGKMPHPRAAAKDSPDTALYRLFDAGGTLLYVGIGRNPMARWAMHAERDWWPAVATFAVEWFPTREAARAVELRAIREEAPLHNTQGTPRGAALTGASVRAALAREQQRLASATTR